MYRPDHVEEREYEDSKLILKLYEFYYDNYINCEGSIKKAKEIIKNQLDMIKNTIY